MKIERLLWWSVSNDCNSQVDNNFGSIRNYRPIINNRLNCAHSFGRMIPPLFDNLVLGKRIRKSGSNPLIVTYVS